LTEVLSGAKWLSRDSPDNYIANSAKASLLAALTQLVPTAQVMFGMDYRFTGTAGRCWFLIGGEILPKRYSEQR
jgi:hypothetical protein